MRPLERRKTHRGWEECDGGQAAIILLGQVGFYIFPPPPQQWLSIGGSFDVTERQDNCPL